MEPERTGHTLGPHVVGQRVVVRRIVRGETGPTGGPAFTDLLGTCLSWGPSHAVIAGEDGTTTQIALADIVSGKPVPPRVSRFSRLSADEVEARCTAFFTPRAVEQVGDWVLRYSGGANGRPNSVLPIGDPGVPASEALERVLAFYAAHDRRPVAQVVVGSPAQQVFEEAGWDRLRPDEADTEVLLAGVARLARQLRDVSTDSVEHADALTKEWLVGNTSAQDNYEAVEASLRLQDAVFASITEDGVQVARGRTNRIGDWVFFADLTVQPHARRRGLARIIMADAVDWAAERGASVMALQVVGDNEPAQRLYAELGFERHHAYRYLVPPS
ncbi:GNAT superfamily N-acetyltransferase [Marmoricola sp. OAE513]|uniref:GNAT family N-acetyltransferase n=1 Tax=Marmoricola sp. OAE513 TaxID=2817894 RepID=UPI001AEA04EA